MRPIWASFWGWLLPSHVTLASYFTFLNLCFHICKMDLMKVFTPFLFSICWNTSPSNPCREDLWVVSFTNPFIGYIVYIFLWEFSKIKVYKVNKLVSHNNSCFLVTKAVMIIDVIIGWFILEGHLENPKVGCSWKKGAHSKCLAPLPVWLGRLWGLAWGFQCPFCCPFCDSQQVRTKMMTAFLITLSVCSFEKQPKEEADWRGMPLPS